MNISVLGLGIIGSAWANNLIADGHSVRCWNRTPKEFPNFQASIQAAVDGAEVIIIVVADPPAVQSVLDQIQSKLGPGVLVIQSSTISAHWTRLFADLEKVLPHNVRLINIRPQVLSESAVYLDMSVGTDSPPSYIDLLRRLA